MLTFNIVSLFPEFFVSSLRTGLVGKAIKNGLIRCNFYNPRDHAHNRHRHVDDRPFGGGPGMIMQLAPLVETLESIGERGKTLLMSPGGAELTGRRARLFAEKNTEMTLICGRYEGIDDRLGSIVPLEEIRVGRAILNGGETAALAALEAICRFVPGFLGSEESASEESFSQGLLEYPQYTRPAVFRGISVPRILLEGNHAAISRWRRDMALQKTLAREPGALEECGLEKKDAEALAGICRERLGRNLSFCLFHYPVRLEEGRIGTSSLTNLDIHDIARISQSYGLGPFFVLTPNEGQLELLRQLLDHWLTGAGGKSNRDRKAALEKVVPVSCTKDLREQLLEHYGREAQFVVTSAAWSKMERLLGISHLREMLTWEPVVLCLGTAKGIATRLLDFEFRTLRPIRFLDENHLSVRSAAAILADRILGDFY